MDFSLIMVTPQGDNGLGGLAEGINVGAAS